jgi:hypothetical protein
MDVADELIALAERSQHSYAAPVLAACVASELPERRLHARAREAADALGGGELHWSVDLEPAGVIVRQWGHATDSGESWRAPARALGDLDGSLVAHAPEPEIESSPLNERDEELLECHLRARGERRLQVPEHEVERAERPGRQPPSPEVTFAPDEPALLAGIEAALAWVGSPPPGAQLRSTSGPHRDIAEVRVQVAYGFGGVGVQWWRLEFRTWWSPTMPSA